MSNLQGMAPKKYTCKWGKNFPAFKRLKCHINSYYDCLLCGRHTNSWDHLIQHYRNLHPTHPLATKSCEPPHYMAVKRTFLASKEPTFCLVGFQQLCLPNEEQLILRNDFYRFWVNHFSDDGINGTKVQIPKWRHMYLKMYLTFHHVPNVPKYLGTSVVLVMRLCPYDVCVCMCVCVCLCVF